MLGIFEDPNRYGHMGGWGGSPTGKSVRVVPCVRMCVRAVCLVRWDFSQNDRLSLSLFPFVVPCFPFSLLGSGAFPCENLWVHVHPSEIK